MAPASTTIIVDSGGEDGRFRTTMPAVPARPEERRTGMLAVHDHALFSTVRRNSHRRESD